MQQASPVRACGATSSLAVELLQGLERRRPWALCGFERELLGTGCQRGSKLRAAQILLGLTVRHAWNAPVPAPKVSTAQCGYLSFPLVVLAMNSPGGSVERVWQSNVCSMLGDDAAVESATRYNESVARQRE